MTTRIGNPPVLEFIQTIRTLVSRGILDGLATIATYTVQADDEAYGGLGGKHCKGFE